VKEYVRQRDQAALGTIHLWDAGSPGCRWMRLAEQSVVNASLPTPLQTRAFALAASAISDATIAAWDSKYAYNRSHPSDLDAAVSPVVAVRQSPPYPSEHALTGGAAAGVLELRPSQADPTIVPVFANPQHPGFPSGHACASGASAAVMSQLFPDDAQFFATTANAAGNSTLDAEIHTPYDVSQGLLLGTQVGQRIAARASADGAN
jgi:membrane-associated phospholipid phosphatase